jgi:hypothetical protein
MGMSVFNLSWIFSLFLLSIFSIQACSGLRLSTRSHGASGKEFFTSEGNTIGLDANKIRAELLRSTNLHKDGNYLYVEAIPVTPALIKARGLSDVAVQSAEMDACFEIKMRSRSNSLNTLPDWTVEITMPDGEKIPGKFSSPKIRSDLAGATMDNAAPIYSLETELCMRRPIFLKDGFRLGIQPKHIAGFPPLELSWDLNK